MVVVVTMAVEAFWVVDDWEIEAAMAMRRRLVTCKK